ncbi:MAG TPA: EcsC family protein [Terriglobales bacterium]|nr:EcsC family protein [Terriglobales bacterium]
MLAQSKSLPVLKTGFWAGESGGQRGLASPPAVGLLFVPPRVALSCTYMLKPTPKSWLREKVEAGLRRGFERAYETVEVDSQAFLSELRMSHGMPIASFHGVYSIEISELDRVARRVIRSGMRMAAVEGAGLGLGGLITIIPDLGILAAITVRTLQKLSLLYGFEFNTEEETAELWVAAASAAGVDISRDLLEKEVVNRFVPRVIRRIAIQASEEAVEKWSGRLIPIASSLIGASLNYYFVRAWGERAKNHFRERHLQIRKHRELQPHATVEDPARFSP